MEGGDRILYMLQHHEEEMMVNRLVKYCADATEMVAFIEGREPNKEDIKKVCSDYRMFLFPAAMAVMGTSDNERVMKAFDELRVCVDRAEERLLSMVE